LAGGTDGLSLCNLTIPKETTFERIVLAEDLGAKKKKARRKVGVRLRSVTMIEGVASLPKSGARRLEVTLQSREIATGRESLLRMDEAFVTPDEHHI
jgi:hypothetical protein